MTEQQILVNFMLHRKPIPPKTLKIEQYQRLGDIQPKDARS